MNYFYDTFEKVLYLTEKANNYPNNNFFFFKKVMVSCRQSPKFEVLFSVLLFYINRTSNFERDLNDEKTSH